ncbi:isoamyl acetate-hydrolyzing esterase [Coemansia sp. RSA 1199]|nr:isoamyl acetate-hydrolyzing esterase [Coemansia sp. RSA 1199]
MLFICIGANDARLPSKTDSSTLEQYQNNMHSIISLLRDPASEYYSPKTRILVITPPPIGELMIQSYTPTFAADPFVFNNRTRLFAEMAKQVAREANVPFIDLYSEIENRVREEQATGTWVSRYDGYDNYLVDGVHLNNKGNMLLYNLILTTFKVVWPEMLPKSLPS